MPDKFDSVAKVAVFRFEVFDRPTRAWRLVPYRATQQHIDTFGGVALPNSRQWVAPAEVDAAGVHHPVLQEG